MYINPPLEKIETQLANLSDKANEILAAVKECCDCEEELEQGEMVEKVEKTQGCKSSSLISQVSRCFSLCLSHNTIYLPLHLLSFIIVAEDVRC